MKRQKKEEKAGNRQIVKEETEARLPKEANVKLKKKM